MCASTFTKVHTLQVVYLQSPDKQQRDAAFLSLPAVNAQCRTLTLICLECNQREKETWELFGRNATNVLQGTQLCWMISDVPACSAVAEEGTQVHNGEAAVRGGTFRHYF